MAQHGLKSADVVSLQVGRRALLLAGVGALLDQLTWGAAPPTPALQPLLAWGEHGKAAGQFDVPIGLAISTRDELYVTDLRNDRVQWFSSGGKPLGSFPVESFTGGLAVDSAGNVYVAPLMGHKVCVYSP